MHKVIFIGNSRFAVPALRAIHASAHSVECVITRDSQPAGRGQKLRPPPVADAGERLGLQVVQTKRPGQGKRYAEQSNPDFLVVCDYGDMIPRSLLRIPRLGSLNIHPSLLPRWRGAAPVERAILAGDSVTGVSIMLMDTSLDGGPVLLSDKVAIASKTAGDLREELAEIGSELVVRALDNFETLTPSYQEEANATYAGKIDPPETEIDWNRDAKHIERLVRALLPKPCAYSRLGAARINFGGAQAREEPAGKPGEILKVTKSAVIVGCGEGSLEIGELQRAGGKMMRASEFLNGFRLDEGTTFSSPGSSVDRANPS